MHITSKRPFGAVAIAMVTPFLPNGEVDLPSAQDLAEKLVDAGCDTLILSGTTGEAPTTHQAEKDALTLAVKEAVGDRAMIICGAGSNDTAHAQRMAQSAEKCGADGLLVVTPYYNQPVQEGIFQHIKAVIESTDLPAMLYDIPRRTGVEMSMHTLTRLASLPQVLAVKDATENIDTGMQKMQQSGLAYYSGDDATNFSWLARGGAGVVSVAGHLFVESLQKLVASFDKGDLESARREQAYQLPLLEAIVAGGQGAVMTKEALQMLGMIPNATVRLPLVRANATELVTLRKVLKQKGLL